MNRYTHHLILIETYEVEPIIIPILYVENYLLKVTANSDQPSEIETRMSACSHLPSFVAIASSVWAHCPHLPSLSILILADLS